MTIEKIYNRIQELSTVDKIVLLEKAFELIPEKRAIESIVNMIIEMGEEEKVIKRLRQDF